jgi:uroporphyrinogen-III decarboxylase
MTSRERVEAAFRHQEPDRTPIFEYVLLTPVAQQLLGRPFVEYLGNTRLWLTEAEKMGFELLGHDMLFAGPNPIPGWRYFYDPLEDLGTHFVLEEKGDPVKRLIERNKKVREVMLGPLPQECYLVYYLLREEMKRRDLDLPILAPSYFHGIWTDADLMQVMLLEPEAAKQHFALATKRAFNVIDDYIKIGIEQVGIGGDFAGDRLLISPESYRNFIVPEVRKCARRIRQAGFHSVNATDGNLWPVIDDFLIGCEVDAYLEIDMGAGMDLSTLKNCYGDKILFFGNMDCGRVLSFSSEEEIRGITLEVLDAGWGNGGHIFCASNAITDSVPLSNYLSMVNAYREKFELPALKL